jgi:ribose transport system substrate-binding protein
MRFASLLGITMLTALLCPACLADAVVLRDGTVVEGDVHGLLTGKIKELSRKDEKPVVLDDIVSTHIGSSADKVDTQSAFSTFRNEHLLIRVRAWVVDWTDDAELFSSRRILFVAVTIKNEDKRRFLRVKTTGFLGTNYQYRMHDDVHNEVRREDKLKNEKFKQSLARVDRIRPEKSGGAWLFFEEPLPKTKHVVLDLCTQVFDIGGQAAISKPALMLIPASRISTPKRRLVDARAAIEAYEKSGSKADFEKAQESVNEIEFLDEMGQSDQLFSRLKKSRRIIRAMKEKPRLVYFANDSAAISSNSVKGALAAGKRFGATVVVRSMPGNSDYDNRVEKKRLLELDIDGIALCPTVWKFNDGQLDEIAAHTNVITHTTDRPASNRLCYISNTTDTQYNRGRAYAQLVKKVTPNGGSVMIFVGPGESSPIAIRQERQGLIDGLFGRTHDSTRYDDPKAGAIKGENYTVLDNGLTLNADADRVQHQMSEAFRSRAFFGCMVTLSSRTTPFMLQKISEGKAGRINLVAVGQDEDTLQAIADGELSSTVAFDEYMRGYESIRVLTALAHGDQTVVPKAGVIQVAPRVVTGDNIVKVWAEQKDFPALRPQPPPLPDSESLMTIYRFRSDGGFSFQMPADGKVSKKGSSRKLGL